MNFVDNWSRFFVVVASLAFADAQIIGGIVPNLIAFCFFVGIIGHFACTGKMLQMLRSKKPFEWISDASQNKMMNAPTDTASELSLEVLNELLEEFDSCCEFIYDFLFLIRTFVFLIEPFLIDVKN